MPNDSPFTIAEYVRWHDVDPAGIVRYDAFLRFVEMAEGEMFRSVGLTITAVAARYGLWLPRRVLHLEYRSPARLDDQLAASIWVSHVGRTSLTLGFEISDARERSAIRATGHMVLVCTEREAAAKRELPSALIEALAPLRMTEPRAAEL
jgi:acyl-CoA thioester hydrolase